MNETVDSSELENDLDNGVCVDFCIDAPIVCWYIVV